MRSTTILVVAVIVILAGAAGAAYYFVGLSGSSSSNTLVVSIASSAGAADASDVPKFYAVYQVLPTLGNFKANINVFDSTTAVAAAMVNGNAQVAETSPATPVNLAATNPNIILVGIASSQPDGILVCRSNVTQLSQLATGHAIVEVSSLTDSTYQLLSYWLNNHGYNSTSVQWRFVAGLANHVAALLAGKIPCGVADVTGTIELLAQPNHQFVEVAPLATLDGKLPLDAWWTTRQFVQAHPDFIVALLKAGILANRWAENKQSYLSYAPSVVGASINSSALAQSWDVIHGINMWDANAPWNSTIAQTIFYFSNLGAQAHGLTDPPPSAWADYSYYSQAIAAVGTAS